MYWWCPSSDLHMQKKKSETLKTYQLKFLSLKSKKREKLTQFKGSYNNNTTINQTSIHIIGVPEGKMIQKETEKLCEGIITGNFPDLMKFVNMFPRNITNPK